MAVYITWIRSAAICAPLLVTAAPALAQTRSIDSEPPQRGA
jgi:hypothetical protein